MGRIVIPFSAPYTATKWALEGLTESYRYELSGTGIDVVSVEPGGFPTGINERVMLPADKPRVASYGELAELPDKLWGGMMQMMRGDDAPDPQAVADAIVQLIETPAGQRPLRTVVDPLTGGEGPATLNRTSDRIQKHFLGAFDMGDLLSVKPEE
jgi:NAD(P)-dependent dehydrogenase (short-subunit alcohol dehydrogenase family)